MIELSAAGHAAVDGALSVRVGDIVAKVATEAGDAAAAGPVDAMLQAIRRAAEVGDLTAVRDAAEKQVAASRRSWQLASKVLRELEELSATQAAAEQAVRSAAVADARIAAALDPVAGAHAWARTFASALGQGDLACCERLASAPPFAEDLPLVGELIRDGAAALRGEDWSGAVLRLLRFLAGAFTEMGADTAEERHAYAAVLVLMGRVALVERDDPQAALRRFRRARDVAPDSALPLAARAAYHHRRGEYGAGIAKAQRAVELAPERPEGYVALGLCAEGQGAPQAVDFYDKAVARVWDRDDPHAALRTFLATGSRTLMIRLAERADREGRPELALRAIDDAFAQDAPDESSEARWRREAGELDLRARALAALGRTGEAVGAFCDAADRCTWTEDLAAGGDYAKRALGLDKDSSRAHWLLAECLRMSSSTKRTPYVSAGGLGASLRQWNLGAAASVDGLSSWPLWVRALIEEQRSRLPKEERHERLWHAALHLERGLVLDPEDPWALAALARVLRGVNCVAAARQSVERALFWSPAEPTALEERLILLAGAGTVAEMQEAMEPLPPGPWLDAVRAFVLSRAGEPEPALELLEAVERQSGRLEIWQREVRAYCLSLLGDRPEALKAWRGVWARRGGADKSDMLTYGWAAWNLGQLEAAQEIAESLRNDPIDGPPAARLAGLCALERGQLDAAQADLRAGVARSMWDGALREFRDHDLPEMRRRAGAGDAAALCDEAAQWATARLEELRARRAEDDFAVAQALDPPAVVGPQWLAAQAGLARLAGEDERWPEAARCLRRLEPFAAEFPEAGAGRNDAIDALRKRGDDELRGGDPLGAARTYAEVLEAMEGGHDAAVAFGLHARMSVACAELGDAAGAAQHLQVAAAAAGHDGGAVGGVALSLLREVDHFWAVASAWDAARAGLAAEQAALVVDALERLGTYLDEVFQGPAEAVRRWPTAVPIRVELAADLVPPDPSDETWPLPGQSISQMERRIERDTGVTVPRAVGAFDRALRDGEYVLCLDEAFATRGQIPAPRLYCLQSRRDLEAAGIDPKAIDEADDPLDEPACWVDEDAAAAPGVTVPSELHPSTEFVVRRLEALLRENLSAYLGLHHVHDLLEEERDGPEPLFRALTALPDLGARLRFARVLRELVREDVPLGNRANGSGYVAGLRDLLAVELDAVVGAPTLEEAVAAMRRELKERLPGNGSGFARVRVDWTPTPDRALVHLAAVRRIVEATGGRVALIAAHAEARPRIRAMIAAEFPNVPVLATDELLNPSEALDVSVAPAGHDRGVLS